MRCLSFRLTPLCPGHVRRGPGPWGSEQSLFNRSGSYLYFGNIPNCTGAYQSLGRVAWSHGSLSSWSDHRVGLSIRQERLTGPQWVRTCSRGDSGARRLNESVTLDPLLCLLPELSFPSCQEETMGSSREGGAAQG